MTGSSLLEFTETESKLLISIISSASREGSNTITSMCDWNAIAAELGYSTAKSARDQWHKLKARKLKSTNDTAAPPKSVPTSTKRKKYAANGEESEASPSTAKKARKDKQDKQTKAMTPVKEEEVEIGQQSMENGDAGIQSPSTANKASKTKQNKKGKATAAIKEEETEAGEDEQTL